MHRILFGAIAVMLVAACSGTSASSPPTATPFRATVAPALGATIGPLPTAPAGAAASDGNAPGVPAVDGPVQSTPSGLRYVVITPGNGEYLGTGLTVTVNYTGWLTDGTKFDSSVDRNQPFTFKLGAGQVIKGWDEGVSLMQIGEKRRFIIPPNLAYGPTGQGPIPPNATLLFDVEVLSAHP